MSAEQWNLLENVSTTSTVVRYVSNPSAAAARAPPRSEIQERLHHMLLSEDPKEEKEEEVIDPRSSSYPSILVTSNQTKLCGL